MQRILIINGHYVYKSRFPIAHSVNVGQRCRLAARNRSPRLDHGLFNHFFLICGIFIIEYVAGGF